LFGHRLPPASAQRVAAGEGSQKDGPVTVPLAQRQLSKSGFGLLEWIWKGVSRGVLVYGWDAGSVEPGTARRGRGMGLPPRILRGSLRGLRRPPPNPWRPPRGGAGSLRGAREPLRIPGLTESGARRSPRIREGPTSRLGGSPRGSAVSLRGAKELRRIPGLAESRARRSPRIREGSPRGFRGSPRGASRVYPGDRGPARGASRFSRPARRGSALAVIFDWPKREHLGL